MRGVDNSAPEKLKREEKRGREMKKQENEVKAFCCAADRAQEQETEEQRQDNDPPFRNITP